jgi:2-keto-3-deoxy-L-rhamnonate aldolase RhmA
MDNVKISDNICKIISKKHGRNFSLGSWIQTGNAVVGEIMSNSGFDWIAVDLEHTEISINTFANLARVMTIYGVVPMARVSENSTMAIRKVLDCGAMGIIVPLVNNKEDAKRAVVAAKYPPSGIRGFAFCQANGWGKQFDEYVKSANGEILLMVMIETREAVENINAILGVDGVDGVFIGPYDLSGSYGVIGQTNHKLVTDAKKAVLDACKKHRKIAGQHIVLPTRQIVKEAINEGYNFMALGMDTVFISDGAKSVVDMAEC